MAHDDLDHDSDVSIPEETVEGKCQWLQRLRETYYGALLFNICAFTLPAVYGTLSKLWIAKIDSSMVSTAETYVYIGVVVEVINEGLPRAAYKVIGDKTRRTRSERIGITNAMILFQTVLGLLMSIIICAVARKFTQSFVPGEVKEVSERYVRIGAFSAVFSALDMAVSTATRSLDRPDVPLGISSVKTMANIILDLLFLSTCRVTKGEVSVNTQAVIRLCCDAAGAITGLLYYLWISGLLPYRRSNDSCTRTPNLQGLKLMSKPGAYTAAESAVRNTLYLWLVTGIVSLGNDYATAWSIFNTIRWGLVMVPVYSLEATSSTFVGHAWGRFRADPSSDNIFPIVQPAILSAGIALAVEIPLCLIMTFASAYPFALYISQNPAVAEITAYMWRTIDWCYIFYAVSTMGATVLLATRPAWYLAQSLLANICWVLPWAVVVHVHGVKSGNPWFWHALVFGGSLVFSAIAVGVVLFFWVRSVRREARR